MTERTGNSMNTKKKLIEVALPLGAINRGCEEDKNRKTGHIRNLHKWFAPMPLPSWRAMLFATLVDDPGEYLLPHEAERERARLMQIVERLSLFDAYKDTTLLAQARAEVIKAVGSVQPTVVDPFCGGGSTLLEAQRLGLATFASDLNPVPVLITAVLCRIPGLFGNWAPINPTRGGALVGGWSGLEGFKADVTYYASRIRELAWHSLSRYYPTVRGATPFAYRWAWTVASPEPSAQQRHTPLVSNWWLSRHKTARAWVQPVQHDGDIRFVIRTDGEPPSATTGRAGAVCLYSSTPITLEYVREEGRAAYARRCLQ